MNKQSNIIPLESEKPFTRFDIGHVKTLIPPSYPLNELPFKNTK